ncbi:MAG TPA: molecular chaperone TorD family protein, partial [Acetobacteraceae bacterium]|nr:molecular chaperone TorD family protein [Acetobacteraceae bacterium]
MLDTLSLGLDPVDEARAAEYMLLATLLARSPDAALLHRLACLGGDASPLGAAHAALAAAAARTGADAAAREYHDLFVGLARGELLPYASFYLTGFLQGRPLARLRDTMRALGFTRAGGRGEPEDHAATVLELMARLVQTQPGAAGRVFDAHVAAWLPRFFLDLERAGSADFYQSVG